MGEFLFKDGSMIGLSIPLLNNYIEYIANKRLRMIGFNPIYDISSTNNPLPWTNTGSIQEVYRMHHRRLRSNRMLLVELNKMSRMTLLQTLNYEKMARNIMGVKGRG